METNLNLFIQLFTDYTLRNVALGSAVLGIIAGALGCFAVLRKQSLMGDAISHATLPGVALAFLFTLSKSPLPLLLGAILSGWIGMTFANLVIKNTIIKSDAALGIVLSVFFGFGVVLLTVIQKIPIASQAGLVKYLFGNASTLIEEDVILMSILGLCVLFFMILFWKEFKIFIFDKNYAQTLGFKIRWIDLFLTSLIVLAIVIGLQTVGVVLMSAMIIAPAVAARQWTHRLSVMVFLASLFGAMSGMSGAILSSQVQNLPTGPTIVIIISIFFLISIVFAKERGLFWEWIEYQRNKRKIHLKEALIYLFRLSESHEPPFHPHELAHLDILMKGSAEFTLNRLQMIGLTHKNRNNQWNITSEGLDKAKQLLAKEVLKEKYSI